MRATAKLAFDVPLALCRWRLPVKTAPTTSPQFELPSTVGWGLPTLLTNALLKILRVYGLRHFVIFARFILKNKQ